METAHFSLFLHLPQELRLQIWREALPEVGPLLYFYKKGCWDTRHLTEADYDYDPNNDEHNLNLEFHCNRLDPVQIDVPLFFVNREARSSALTWIHEQGLKIRFYKDKQSFRLIRLFNPQHDTVYVSQEQWDEFIYEPFGRIFQPDLENVPVGCPSPAFTRLAVPDGLFLKVPDFLIELFDHYYGLEKIFVIVKTQPDNIWHEENGIKLGQRWELESADMEGPMGYWNCDSKSFQWKDSRKDISNYPLYSLLQDIGPALRTKLLKYGKRQCFKIWPAFAAGK